ncbi:hypothetical protein [Thalassiella azotivora]
MPHTAPLTGLLVATAPALAGNAFAAVGAPRTAGAGDAAVRVLDAATEPVVGAATLVVWAPAAVLAVLAQTDRPTGPAPAANRGPARAAAGLVVLGLLVAAVQAAGAVGVLAGVVPAPESATAWPVLVACLTGAAVVAAAVPGPLARLRRGRAVTDATALRGLHAGLRTGAAGGVVAVLVAVVGAGLQAPGPAAGPYLAPVVLAALVVLVAHRVLRATLTT